MRIFVTGASGFIGSAVVPELLAAGHQVIGLARSDRSAQNILAAGAAVHYGSLDDLESLRTGAAAADGVIHLAYNHDFSQPQAAAQTDFQAVQTFGEVLKGSDRPLVIASGVVGLAPGRLATEQDKSSTSAHPRFATAQATLDLAQQGVRSSVLRLSPTVHGKGDPGFVAVLIQIARQKGVAGFIEEGNSRWPTVHRLDAARLFRHAVEKAPAGSVLHGVAEEGVSQRDIAGVIGRHLGVPVASIPADQAAEHFGWLARFLSLDSRVSSTLTRELLDWEPTHPGLLEDLEEGHYFGVLA
ncbi:SDR family oxidoreductase [Deinococcus roseus]|uniref:Oxidoreductase n=1 Tax=Deinococcus roseus TaxID=392414 RepID=A0ABQ2D216_9DEIO|nr:SDR family oxidoreductase [Deinococcus roseus]GGJ35812.1 oxidoreductase [Deinococcus roseus]